MKTAPRCVICGGPVGSIAENKVFPFCSRRCQLIDLGRWLDGEYCIPGEPDDESGRADGSSGDDEQLETG